MDVFCMKFKFTIYLRPPDELVLNVLLRLYVDTAGVHAPSHFEIIIYSMLNEGEVKTSM